MVPITLAENGLLWERPRRDMRRRSPREQPLVRVITLSHPKIQRCSHVVDARLSAHALLGPFNSVVADLRDGVQKR
jgi:hypothetical protein